MYEQVADKRGFILGLYIKFKLMFYRNAIKTLLQGTLKAMSFPNFIRNLISKYKTLFWEFLVKKGIDFLHLKKFLLLHLY